MARANMAWVAWRQGNVNEAQLNGQAALELWQPPVIMPFMSLALWPLIGVRMAHNQVAEAIDLVLALTSPEQQPMPDRLAFVVDKVTATWETGDLELARAYLDQAAEVAKGPGYL